MLFPILALLTPVFAGLSAIRLGTTAAVVITPIALRSAKRELRAVKKNSKWERHTGLTAERRQLEVVQEAIDDAPMRLGRAMTKAEVRRLEAESLRITLVPPDKVEFPNCSKEFQELANGTYFLTKMEWLQLRTACHDLMIWWKEDVEDIRFLMSVAERAGVSYEEVRGAASEPLDEYGGSVSIRILKELSARRLQDQELVREVQGQKTA